MPVPELAYADVLRVRDVEPQALEALLAAFSLSLEQVADQQAIPGSHWGDDEAGLIQQRVLVRQDTPIHSLMHEACHAIVMDDRRRLQLHTNAGGTLLEECAVCYLQILLADQLAPMNRERMFDDMDAWGYNFRLGSSRRWFEEDAEDALEFLRLWLAKINATRYGDTTAEPGSASYQLGAANISDRMLTILHELVVAD